MELNDSTNLEPSWFGPDLPIYPQVDSICRVYGGSFGGFNIYNAFAAQSDVSVIPLAMRDREAVIVYEPNGTTLNPGYYECRLMGNYLNLPLYVTTCCPTSSSSSASA